MRRRVLVTLSSFAMKSGATFVLVAGLCLVGSCSSGLAPDCEAFLALSSSERQSALEKSALDKQIDLCLCAMKQEPPDLGLARQISARGAEAIPLLLEKLKSAKSEVDQHDLIYIFELMSREGLLRGKPDVVSAIADVVDVMKVEPVRKDTADRLKKIQINSGITPFTRIPG
jgi:hypothetical protein